MPEEEQQNTNEEKQNTNLPTSINKTENNTPNQQTQKQKEPRRYIRNIFTISDFIQIGLFIINIGMLIAFIYMGTRQIKNTQKTIDYADSSNIYTRESINIARDQFAYQRQRDSINAIIQNEKDSLFAFSQYKRDSLSERNAEIELRAYMWLDSVNFNIFRVNQNISMYVGFINTGKTPAYEATIRMKWKIGKEEDEGVWDIESNNPAPVYTLPQNKGRMGAIIYTNNALTKKDSINIMNGNIFVGCSGKAYYRDIFGHHDSLTICDYFFSEKKQFIDCDATAKNKKIWPNVIK